MKTRARMQAFALAAAIVAGSDYLMAQTTVQDGGATLRANVERRFDVLPLRDGVALRPRNGTRGVRSIEITQGPIAIDGQPVTGAELRDRLGPEDANLVLELSYLRETERAALFRDRPQESSPVVAPSPPPERVGPGRADRRRRANRGGRVQIGNSVSVAEGEVVEDDVVAIGGSVTVDGEVHGDVVSVGGNVTLGPQADVSQNVVVVGGQLQRDPGARVGGKVQEVGLGGLNLGDMRPRGLLGLWRRSMVGSVFSLVGTLTRVAILCLLAALVVLVGAPYAEGAGERAVHEPLKSGAIGFLAQVLFLPVLVITVVLLVVTIVGIPLLLLIPFLMLGLAIVGLVGFTGVAHKVGAAVGSKFGWAAGNPYKSTIVGILVMASPALLARLVGLASGGAWPMTFGLGVFGALLEYLAWTVGFGAVALMRFGQRTTVA